MRVTGLSLAWLLLMPMGQVQAAAAPAGHPINWHKDGEPQPSWWSELCLNPVIVVEGSLEINRREEADFHVETSRALLERLYPNLSWASEEPNRIYYVISELTITKVLYVSPELARKDNRIKAIKAGELTALPVIYEANRVPYDSNPPRDPPGAVYRPNMPVENCIFILEETIPYHPPGFIYRNHIPVDELEQAKLVIAHRQSADQKLEKALQTRDAVVE